MGGPNSHPQSSLMTMTRNRSLFMSYELGPMAKTSFFIYLLLFLNVWMVYRLKLLFWSLLELE
jgi:hypothetical protein